MAVAHSKIKGKHLFCDSNFSIYTNFWGQMTLTVGHGRQYRLFMEYFFKKNLIKKQ